MSLMKNKFMNKLQKTLPSWLVSYQARLRKHLFNKINDDEYINEIRHHNHILPDTKLCRYCLALTRDLPSVAERLKE